MTVNIQIPPKAVLLPQIPRALLFYLHLLLLRPLMPRSSATLIFLEALTYHPSNITSSAYAKLKMVP
jgi:hypothetical protein